MQIWAEPEKAALPICNYSQILYQFFAFTQNLKRSRSCHYNTFTDKEWGNRHNYDLMLNSSTLGYQKCANTICSIVRE